MKGKYFMGCLIALCFVPFGAAHAGSNLNILQLSGSEKQVTASTLRTITFSGSNMNLNYQDGNSEAIALSDIRKLFFSSASMSLENVKENRLCVYPNPASDVVFLKNLPLGAKQATVWSISGRKMCQIVLSSETNSLDISMLPSGLYLLGIDNQTLLFSKK